jgi:hypothetical protein
MIRSPWKRFVLDHDTADRQSNGRRRQTKRSAQCEALESRQLLSTLAPAASEFSVPSSAVAAKSATILESIAPRAFAQFQNALARAEQQSHVNPADVTALAQDEAVVDQDLQSANASGENDVQDWVDNAFTYEAGGIRDVRRNLVPLSDVSLKLDKIVEGAPAVFNASGSDGSISPIDQLIDQIIVVAKQARVTPAVQSALNRSYAVLNKALGPHPYVSLGPGANNVRDPLVVYYDAQIDSFTK